MRRYCEKLVDEYEWKAIPSRWRRWTDISDSLGRCAFIFFKDGGVAPAIALGFYYAPDVDHRIPLVDANKPIDLHLRIFASPSNNPSPDRVLELLRVRVPGLQRLGVTARLKKDRENRNKHTLLVAQKSLLDIVDGISDEGDQLDAIHAELSGWCRQLFVKSDLVEAFEAIKPYS